MCGRFHLEPEEDFYPRFGIKHKDDDYVLQRNINISPGQFIPTIVSEKGKNRISPMKWGFIPHWSKDERIGYKMINARAETVVEKPSFKKAFLESRCLIPATGFYEWKQVGKEKIPHLFQLPDDKYFAFAGLYSLWKNHEGKELPTCTIITSQANSSVKTIHERMPVILDRDEESLWLEEDDKDLLQSILDTNDTKLNVTATKL